MKNFSLPKTKRLVSNKQFRAVLARKLRRSNGLITLFMAENDCGYPRLGLSVAKACGNAVTRNRLKRILTEAFRQSQDQIPPGFDYVIMVCPQPILRKTAKCRPPQSPKNVNSPDRSGKKMKMVTFEQIKSSFLTLVAALAEKAHRNKDSSSPEHRKVDNKNCT
ncbi:MAG: ribonuclease P protein component [Planctomycetota bacterium]